MESLLEKNIYDVKGKVLIYGTCLPHMEKEAFSILKKDYDEILPFCLEKDHINMAIAKICGILRCGNVTYLAFASVNHSPHCTGLHYIKREIYKTMDKNKIPIIENFVVENNRIYKIDESAILLSKDLIKLQESYEES